jgi:hypothetical protein
VRRRPIQQGPPKPVMPKQLALPAARVPPPPAQIAAGQADLHPGRRTSSRQNEQVCQRRTEHNRQCCRRGPGPHHGRSADLPLTTLKRQSRPGHVGGTSPRDLLRSDENSRDLSRRSDDKRDGSAKVSEACAQDPAYRPTQSGQQQPRLRCTSVWPPRAPNCLPRPG